MRRFERLQTLVSRTTMSLAVALTGLTVAACMPVPADDFSMLGDDVFARAVVEAHSDKNLTPGHSSGVNGVGSIDPVRLGERATQLFVGKPKDEVVSLFAASQGQCAPQLPDASMRCEIVKTWRLKNTGGDFNTQNWSAPSARLIYLFSLDASGRVRAAKVEIVDVTKYKPIRG
jgi:hypothetical protein